MDDHRGEPRERRDEHERGGDRGGPPDTQWLALEMSKVIQAGAEGLARTAAEEIVKEAIKERLRERLGPRLEAVGRLVADQLADDIEQNLDIEARIAARRDARRALDGRIAEALGALGPRREGELVHDGAASGPKPRSPAEP